MRSSISTDDSILGVKQSVQTQCWTRRLPADDPAPFRIEQATGCNATLAKVLAGRGVTPEDASQMLAPSLRALMPDPSTLQAMDDAAMLLADAVEAGATVGLFGDYDVDGAASCALMARWLTVLGARPVVHIPDRVTEGYGPNSPAIDALVEEGVDLLITLDCGATSHEALAHARAKGLPVLVLDHHQMTDLGPDVEAVVNPNRPDDVSGLGHLCAAGVTFMALVSANRELRARGREGDLPDLLALLDLVALATVADVVPLTGLNRAFVVQGLKVARARRNPGLSALIETARLSGPLQAFHFGYVLGPRINAGGRIGDAAMGARLLTSNDPAEVLHLAAELDTLNAQRQAIEAEAVADAISRIDQMGCVPDVIMVRDETWHQGVIGLIAARLKERFHRPSFAFTRGADGHWTGSARSIPGVDLGSAVRALVEDGVALKGGGHAMAAGLTLDDAGWQKAEADLRSALSDALAERLSVRDLEIDAVLTAGAASLDLIAALEAAAPYGTGFPEPVFAFASHRVTYADRVGTNHVKVTLSDGNATLSAIAFRAADTPLGDLLVSARGQAPLHVAGSLSRNSWQGRDSAQLRLIDAARPTRS